MRDHLGAYLKSKLKRNIPENEVEAARGIGDTGKKKAELKQLWQEQKFVQLSVRACMFVSPRQDCYSQLSRCT